jgi:hypothetical protein
MKPSVAAFALAALLPTQAMALTGSDLYRMCVEEAKNSVGDAACNSYVRGFIDGLMITTFMANRGEKFCVPNDGIALNQARLMLEKSLRDHPDMLHMEGAYFLGLTLRDAFRCP